MRLKVEREDEKRARGTQDPGEREKESYFLSYFFCVSSIITKKKLRKKHVEL